MRKQFVQSKTPNNNHGSPYSAVPFCVPCSATLALAQSSCWAAIWDQQTQWCLAGGKVLDVGTTNCTIGAAINGVESKVIYTGRDSSGWHIVTTTVCCNYGPLGSSFCVSPPTAIGFDDPPHIYFMSQHY